MMHEWMDRGVNGGSEWWVDRWWMGKWMDELVVDRWVDSGWVERWMDG